MSDEFKPKFQSVNDTAHRIAATIIVEFDVESTNGFITNLIKSDVQQVYDAGQDKLTDARNSALEEAAKECDAKAKAWWPDKSFRDAEKLAKKIRALKT